MTGSFWLGCPFTLFLFPKNGGLLFSVKWKLHILPKCFSKQAPLVTVLLRDTVQSLLHPLPSFSHTSSTLFPSLLNSIPPPQLILFNHPQSFSFYPFISIFLLFPSICISGLCVYLPFHYLLYAFPFPPLILSLLFSSVVCICDVTLF